jgi:hypothetical protein
MHITVQGAQMPWDNIDNWEDGLCSLRYLKCFLLWSWQFLREGDSVKDIFIHQCSFFHLLNCMMSLFGPELVRIKVDLLCGGLMMKGESG